MKFYAYLWLRADGTPYYAGKGSGRRAFQKHRLGRMLYPPKEKSNILLIPCGTEAEAFAQEMVLIDLYGRKDEGTGILRNFADGGEGSAGRIMSPQLRARVGRWNKGMKRSAEFKAAVSLRQLGRVHSDATRRKMSASAQLRQRGPNGRFMVK
jgi:hypothetical protein